MGRGTSRHFVGGGKPRRSLGCDRPLRGASLFGAGKPPLNAASYPIRDVAGTNNTTFATHRGEPRCRGSWSVQRAHTSNVALRRGLPPPKVGRPAKLSITAQSAGWLACPAVIREPSSSLRALHHQPPSPHRRAPSTAQPSPDTVSAVTLSPKVTADTVSAATPTREEAADIVSAASLDAKVAADTVSAATLTNLTTPHRADRQRTDASPALTPRPAPRRRALSRAPAHRTRRRAARGTRTCRAPAA
jgi:hypothetical protein